MARAGHDRGGLQRCGRGAGGARGHALLLPAQGIRRLGAGQEAARDGVFLSRHAQAIRCADGGRQARRRRVELRPRQPRQLRPQGPGHGPGTAALRARRHHPRSAGGSGGALRRPPGGAGVLCVARHAGAGRGCAGGFRSAAAAAVRPLPGRHVAGRAVAVPRASRRRHEPQVARPARRGGSRRRRLALRARAARGRGRLRAPGAGLARVHPRRVLAGDAGLCRAQPLRSPARAAGVLLGRRHGPATACDSASATPSRTVTPTTSSA